MTGDTMRCLALIVAGGQGARFGASVPKQYLPLAGEPLLRRTLGCFLGHPGVDGVRVVIRADDRDLYGRAVTGLDLLPPVSGGASRQESVRNGLESAVDLAPEAVLIHDAARPFTTRKLIDGVLGALATHAGAIPAVPVRDTLKRAGPARDGGTLITETVDRSSLWRAQTPQGFRFDAILAAHRAAAQTELTDDAAVAEAAGLGVAITPGDEDNLKVTTQDDLIRAERMVSGGGETRTGFGYDVHRCGPGDHVMLGGVCIPAQSGLVGHSDADVALHALTDAVLGAIAAGDIGQHFPPSDDRWKGAASEVFLRHAGGLVRERGGAVINVDVTIVAERPRIGPHREAIAERIAHILGIAPSRVGVKATTTEKLGFTGRREGIAAQAVATVRLPAAD